MLEGRFSAPGQFIDIKYLDRHFLVRIAHAFAQKCGKKYLFPQGLSIDKKLEIKGDYTLHVLATVCFKDENDVPFQSQVEIWPWQQRFVLV